VKGAHRPKSAFLGQYDLFYTCELLFYARDRGGLHIIRECAPIEVRRPLRSDWRAAACASYACDIIRRTVHGGTPAAGFYGVAGRTLDALCRVGASVPLLFWFELQMVRELGLAPRLRSCAGCGGPLDEGASWVFSPDRGGMVCGKCSGSGRHVMYVPHRAAALLRTCQDLTSAGAAAQLRAPPNQLLVLRQVLGVFLTFHLEGLPSSRKIAMDLAFSASVGSAENNQAKNRTGALP